MKKKIVSLLLIALIVLSAVPTSVNKAGAASTAFGKVNFLQGDARWKDMKYGENDLLSSGSGILAIVNAVYNCTRNFLEPTDVADWAYEKSLFNKGAYPGVTDRSIFSQAAVKYGDDFGFKFASSGWCSSSSAELKDHVRNKGTAIVHVPGHFLTLADYNEAEDKFFVLDSAPGSGGDIEFPERKGLTTADGDWKTAEELSTGKIAIDYYWLYQPKDLDAVPNPNDYEYPQRQLYYNSASLMTGSDVMWMQAGLYRLGYTIDVDGKFGPATKAVVLQFQSDYGLDSDGYFGPLSCAKLKEEWEKIDPSAGLYSFTFDANGGTMGPDTAFNTKYGKDFIVLNTTTVRKGYTFGGWYVKRNADSKYVVQEGYWSTEAEMQEKGYHFQVYTNNRKLRFDDTWTIDYDGVSSYTFYAIWNAIPTYSVKYDANGGTGAPESQEKIKDETLKLSTVVPSRESYYFRGWASDPSAQRTEYYPGAEYTENADIILYALWAKDIVLGDVNGDGEVDAIDAVDVLKYDAGIINFDDDQILSGDVNGDGEADADDAVVILKYDAGILDVI